MIVIDASGDRKDGTATAHVGRQWLGRLGNTDNGIFTVTTVWTDGHVSRAARPALHPRPPLRSRPVRSGLLPSRTLPPRPSCPRGGLSRWTPGGSLPTTRMWQPASPTSRAVSSRRTPTEASTFTRYQELRISLRPLMKTWQPSHAPGLLSLPNRSPFAS
ncbi:transposase [Streptomyces canus]